LCIGLCFSINLFIFWCVQSSKNPIFNSFLYETLLPLLLCGSLPPTFINTLLAQYRQQSNHARTSYLTLQHDILVTQGNGRNDKLEAKCSQGWIFGDNIAVKLSRGASPTDDHSTTMSPYFPYFGGIIPSLYIIHKMRGYYQVT
jgi:hypothetical protein